MYEPSKYGFRMVVLFIKIDLVLLVECKHFSLKTTLALYLYLQVESTAIEECGTFIKYYIVGNPQNKKSTSVLRLKTRPKIDRYGINVQKSHSIVFCPCPFSQ